MPLQIPVTQTGLEASIQQAMKNAGRNAQINLGTNSRQINALAQPLGRITGQADEFTKSMEAANARVFAFGASVGIINGVSKAFGALVKNTIEVEKSLVEINTVLNTSGDSLQKFGNKLFDVAKTTGQTFDVVAKGALELARQGLSTEETLKRINDALILSRLSGLDAQQSVEGLTAAFNSFKETGITTSQILNKLVVVSQKYSVSERDLIEGLKRSASVADQAGVSFDELVGIITTVQERTARGGAVIGNAFKTIFARIQDTGALQDLANLGIQVTDLEGKVLPATRILQNLGAEFNNLSQLEQADIAKKLGGVYQLSNLLAAVKDLSSEQSKYNDIVKLSAGATNEAYQKNAALNETLDALINKVSVSAQQLGATLGAIGITDNLKQLLDFFNKILEGIQGILGEESMLGDMFRGLAKGIGNVLAGPGLALFGAIIAKLSKDLISFGLESLKSFFKIGQSAKEIASVEKSIAAALGSNLTLQKQLFALEGNRAAQIKLMTDAIVQQEAVMRRMASTAGSLAGPLYQQGVRSAGGQGLRVPKAAGGYMPVVSQESRDISRGVGGARGGDKPVVIPNFAFGGGKKGTMVAHTGEYIVPNFAAGGSAIFNRDMVRSMGLPAGAQKIGAAGGFIPNFASLETQSTKVLEKYAAGIGRDITSEKQNAARAILQQRKGGKLPLNKLTKINPNGSDFGMIVGQRGVSSQVSRFADEAGRVSSTQTQGSKYLIDIPIYRVQDDKLKFKESKTINEQLSNISAKTALKMAKDLSGGQLPNPDNIQLIKGLLNPGALAGTAGAIFEAGIAGILKDDDFKDYAAIDRNSLIDFKPYGRIRELFNVPGSQASKGLEAKATDADSLISSAAGKFLKNAKGLAAFGSKKASKGYIPNFANPLKEAINREMSAGIPASQIYVDQNSSLKNSMNPMGLMVANRRDEPGGGMQGINRARKEGANPMTYGASRGFVPNFQRRFGTGSQPPASLGGGSSGASSDVEPVKRDLLGVIFAVQTGLSLLTGATADATGGLGKLTNGIASVASSYATVRLISEGLSSSAGKLGPTLGRLGPYAAAAVAGFEAFKVSVQLYRDWMGKTAEAAKSTAKFNDAVQAAGISLDNLSQSESLKKTKSAEGALYNLGAGFGLSGREYKDPELQRMYAQASLISGMSEKEIAQKAEQSGALKITGYQRLATGGTRAVGEDFDPDKFKQVLAEITAMPEKMIDGKINPEYEKRIKLLQKLKEQQDKLNQDINEPQKIAEAARASSKQLEQTIKNIQIESSLRKKLFQQTSKANDAQIAADSDIANIKSDITLSELERNKLIGRRQFQLEKDLAILENQKSEMTEIANLAKEISEKSMEVGATNKVGAALQTENAIKALSGQDINATTDVAKMLGDMKIDFGLINYETVLRSVLNAALKIQDAAAKTTEEFNQQNNFKERGLSLAEAEAKINENNSRVFEKMQNSMSAMADDRAADARRLGYQSQLVEAEKDVKLAKLETSDSVMSSSKRVEQQRAIEKEAFNKQLEINTRKSVIEAEADFIRNSKVQDNIIALQNNNTALENNTNALLKLAPAAGVPAAGVPAAGVPAVELSNVLKGIPSILKTSINDIRTTGNATLDRQRVNLDQTMLNAIVSMQAKYGAERLPVTSLRRTDSGQHKYGKAVDFDVSKLSDEEYRQLLIDLKNLGARGFGDYGGSQFGGKANGKDMYYQNMLHADWRNNAMAWGPNESGSTIGQTNRIFENFARNDLKAANLGGAGLPNVNLGEGVATIPSNVKIASTEDQMKKARELSSLATSTEILTKAREYTKELGLQDNAAESVANQIKDFALRIKEVGEDKALQENLQKSKEEAQGIRDAINSIAKSEKIGLQTQLEDFKESPITFKEGMENGFLALQVKQAQFSYNLGKEVPELFSQGMSDAITSAITGAESLEDALLNAANSFLTEINKRLMSNLVDQATSSLGNFGMSLFQNKASGGMITGGSGTKDDVPAMLMSGEYVVKKKAVQKYGPDFLNAINNGALSGYAKGGKVKKTYEAQTGEGGYFLPGLYDNKSIIGSDALMSFATQSYTSGARDIISSGSNFASIDLEQESVRLSQKGRENSPLFAATQSAKEQALGIVFEQQSRDEEYRKALEEAKRQEKARKKAIRKQLLISSAIAIGSAVAGPLLGAAASGFQAAAGASQAAGGGFFANMGAGLKGVFTGGQLSGITQNVGGLNNLFAGVGKGLTGNFAEAGNLLKLSQIGNMAKFDASYMKNVFANNGKGTPFLDFAQGIGYTSKAINPYSNMGVGLNGGNDFNWFQKVFAPAGSALNNINNSRQQRRATGGTIPETSGIDTVPAMLSGGEFIMNRAAAQNIGAGNLQALNAGASSFPTEEKTEELNDKLISKLDELIQANSSKSSVGAININVDGSGKSNESNSGGQAGTANQQLARNVRDMVVKVIQDEQRLGGLLR